MAFVSLYMIRDHASLTGSIMIGALIDESRFYIVYHADSGKIAEDVRHLNLFKIHSTIENEDL